MDISINGKTADIILETEKNIGDILSGLDQWLAGSGSRLSGLCIDNREISADELPLALKMDLTGIKAIDIRISSWDCLAVEALGDLKGYCDLYNNSAFEERQSVIKTWDESAAKQFLSIEIKDLYDIASLSFGGHGISILDLGFLVDERIRELANPAAEICAIEKPVSEITVRMEELPLDIQTGKDARAAETIQFFSRLGEKLFRLLKIIDQRGLNQNGFTFDSYKIDEQPLTGFLNDFGTALKELTAAYGNQDAVLVGDLAEYELAPRLSKLFTALKEYSLEEAAR